MEPGLRERRCPERSQAPRRVPHCAWNGCRESLSCEVRGEPRGQRPGNPQRLAVPGGADMTAAGQKKAGGKRQASFRPLTAGKAAAITGYSCEPRPPLLEDGADDQTT
jgi:hypothetical protein